MSLPCDPDTLAWAKLLVPIAASFVLGLLVPRFWLTKKDRRDLEQKNYENTTRLIEQHDGAYDEYAKAISAYTAAPGVDAGAFVEIATKGDRYLYQLNLLAAAILSGKVDERVRDEVLFPKVRRAAAETLPDRYATLKEVAEKHGIPYEGELRRSDYGAIYSVVERFGRGAVWDA